MRKRSWERARMKKQTRLKIEKRNSIEYALLAVLPAIAFYLMEFYDRNPFEQIRWQAQWFNIFLFEFITWMGFFLSKSARVALRITWILAMIFGLTNHYVMKFRSTPFVPWDIFSIRTAANVADNYDFTPNLSVVVITVLFLLGIVLMQFLHLRFQKKLYWRLIPFAILLILFFVFVGRLQDEKFQTRHRLYPYLFTPSVMTKYNGLAVTFAMDFAYVFVEKPKGYDKEEAKETLASYEKKEEPEKQEELPNVIVIMDEAFSDLSVLGNFSISEDCMPFVHQLQKGAKNTITGNLHVSVCGGNTANTEYEFLTGNSMAFLPSGSIPYQQYVKDKIPSLASHLSRLGYETYSIHPYNASGWERDEVYPWMGFDEFYSLDDFSGVSYLRSYVSDESSFEKIKSVYENKKDNTPVFIFNVTMQNHGSYSQVYDNFTPDLFVEGSTNSSLSQYLSLIKRSDEAFENLIEYFQNQEEKTVVVFFGDHQPADAVTDSIWYLNQIDSENLTKEQQKARYEVPYVIWANYEIEEAIGEDTSANFLASKVLRAAGIPLSAYQEYLYQLQEDYPVFSVMQQDAVEEDALKEYQKLQYYLMFDWEEEE